MIEKLNTATAEKSTRRTPKFRRRAEARPDEVLDAALALFKEKGFAATRVEDIAKYANLSKGAVYLYFPSKEALLEGLVRRAIVPVADQALKMAVKIEGDPRVGMSTVLRMLVTQLQETDSFAIPKIVMREAAIVPEIAQMYRAAVLDRALPALTGLIRKGIADGYFRPVDPELTVRSVIGPILAHVLLKEVFGVVPDEGFSADRLIENHLAILFDGLSAPKGAE